MELKFKITINGETEITKDRKRVEEVLKMIEDGVPGEYEVEVLK